MSERLNKYLRFQYIIRFRNRSAIILLNILGYKLIQHFKWNTYFLIDKAYHICMLYDKHVRQGYFTCLTKFKVV